MKRGKNKEKELWNSGPEEQHHGEFHGFSFCLICSRLGTDKGGNLENSNYAHKNSQENPAHPSQGTWKVEC